MLTLRNMVSVRPAPVADTSNGGIYIGAMPPPVHNYGDVVDVGEECDTVKPGDRVMYMPRRAVNQDGLHLISEADDILYIEPKQA